MERSLRPLILLVLFGLALSGSAQITEQEPNDNYAQANFLPANTTMSGVTCWAPEADYFFIVPPTDGVMRLITSISANTPAPIPDDLRIAPISDELHSYGDAMPLVGANDVAITDTMYWSCVASDTVFLYMHNSTMFNGYCYSYAIQYEMIAPYFATEVEPNNSVAEALPLPYDTEMEGHLGFITDPAWGGSDIYDYFRIVLPEDGTLRVIVESENTGGLLSPINVHLEGFYAQALETGMNSIPLIDTLYWPCVNADTFALQMAMPTYTDCGVSYRIRYEVAAPYFETETEPNNSVAEALDLPYATDMEGHLGFMAYSGFGGSDIYDFFRIVLPDDGTLRVIIESENTGGLLTPINVHLEGVYAQALETGMNSIPLLDTLYWPCVNADTFELRLAMPTYTDCGVSYRIRYDVMTHAFAGDVEPNNEFAEATPVVMDVPVDGHLRYGWQTSDHFDMYRVVKADTGHFRIISEATTAGITLQGLRLQVYDHAWNPIGSPVASVGEASVVVTDTNTILNAPIDTLYIRVSFEPGDCGAYRLWLSTLSTVGLGPAAALPVAHALRVFPNPAVEWLTLTYDLTSSQRVRIRLLDMHGRTVRTLADEVRPPGEQRMLIDTRSLAAGAYTVEVSTGVGNGARQLIIVRH
ncbi:MAG: T9SS type A sorting domain-containing protein [Flavobacteriales bacterium]|nr:T9SS type A sorting domain-containing protein [Flavobacteriales bacterium]MBP6698423.1 T9SS type A sorting domain-containing protein [Flavobacteriales bacterium]